MKITFLGGVEEVTGSKYLVEHKDTKILVDCGLFQGNRTLTQHNWDPFPINPETIDAIILTHAHIDHTGYIPALIKHGFKGPIYCSKATYETCVILLMDSASLQENEAKYHQPPTKPLYTKLDAEKALSFFRVSDYDVVLRVKFLQFTLVRSGHILGSAFVIVSDGKQKLTFSGDLGRPHQELLKVPPSIKETDFLVLESTYGDKLHGEEDPEKALAEAIDATVKKNGVLIIPSFSVMRTQTILYYLYQLKQKNLIPGIPIFLDSPSAIRVTDLFCKFIDEHIIPVDVCKAMMSVATYTPTVEESKRIDHINGSAIIIAGSGMADGGRVIYHLQHFVSDPKNTVLFVGYQALGSKGRYLVDGEKNLRIHGQEYPVRAEIKTVNALSAHADYEEILEWLSHFEHAPKKVFLTHGEVEASLALKKKIEERFGWTVVLPKYLEAFDLD